MAYVSIDTSLMATSFVCEAENDTDCICENCENYDSNISGIVVVPGWKTLQDSPLHKSHNFVLVLFEYGNKRDTPNSYRLSYHVRNVTLRDRLALMVGLIVLVTLMTSDAV